MCFLCLSQSSPLPILTARQGLNASSTCYAYCWFPSGMGVYFSSPPASLSNTEKIKIKASTGFKYVWEEYISFLNADYLFGFNMLTKRIPVERIWAHITLCHSPGPSRHLNLSSLVHLGIKCYNSKSSWRNFSVDAFFWMSHWCTTKREFLWEDVWI